MGEMDGTVDRAVGAPSARRSPLDRIAASPGLAFACIVVLCTAAFSPVLRGFYTPEFVAHYEQIIREDPGAPRGVDFVAWEAREWGKIRPLPALVHLGLLEVGGPYSPLHGYVLVLVVALAGFLVFLVLKPWPGPTTGLTAALLFLIAPARPAVSTVLHAMSLERVMALVFILASYVLWRHSFSRASRVARVAALTGSVTAYLLALASKESIMLLPLAFPFLVSSQPVGRVRHRTLVAALAPLIVTLGAFLALRFALRSDFRYGLPDQEAPPDWGHLAGNLLMAGGMLLGAMKPSQAASAAAWCAIILAHVCVPAWRSRLAGVLWIMLAIAPHLLQQYFGANYVYMALPWICFLVVIVVERALRSVPVLNLHAAALWGLAILVMSAASYRTIRVRAAPWVAVADAAQAVGHACPHGANRLSLWTDGTREDWGSKHAQVLSRLTGVPIPRVVCDRRADMAGLGHDVIRGRSLGLRWALRVNCRAGPAMRRQQRSAP